MTTVIRETPGFGIYFLAYDTLTRALGCDADDGYIIPSCSWRAACREWRLGSPRIPLTSLSPASRRMEWAEQQVRRHRWTAVRQSLRREGWRAFTRGLTSTLLRAFSQRHNLRHRHALPHVHARGRRRREGLRIMQTTLQPRSL